MSSQNSTRHVSAEKLACHQVWQAEKGRYKLTEFGDGRFAFMLKPGDECKQPQYSVCVNCFYKQRISILQKVKGIVYVCPACDNEFALGDGPARGFAAADGEPYTIVYRGENGVLVAVKNA